MQNLPETPSTSLPGSWIDRLFVRLGAIYGNKFADAWESQSIEEVKAVWADELAGYTADEIRAGLIALRQRAPTWPPTLFEFAAYCRPLARGPADPEIGFHEAVRGLDQRKRGEAGEWSHPAIYWAAQDVGPFDVLNCTWPQLRARWSAALERRLAEANLPPIPVPPPQLPAPPRDIEVDKANLARIKAMIAERPPGGKANGAAP